MKAPFQPDGWRTVTPRLLTPDVDGLVAFLKSVFDAQGETHPGRPAEMHIGDSIVMVSDGGGGVRETSASFLYVYVEDADETYRQAIESGARVIEAPTDPPYGDRRATITDAWGNTWQIATNKRGYPAAQDGVRCAGDRRRSLGVGGGAADAARTQGQDRHGRSTWIAADF